MVPGTNLNPCISLHTSWHGKGRATFVRFLTHFQGDIRSIQILFPTCLPSTGKNTLCKDHFMPPLAQKQHDDCYWTNSISQTCPRDLLNAAKTDAAQDSQGFGQFYLYASLHNTHFYKMKCSFSSQNIYEILLEYASLRTSLTMLSASGPKARAVPLSRCQSCFSLD